MNKPDNITKNDWKLLTNKYKNLDKIVKKLKNNYPVQYLIGDVDFYGNKIIVNKNVLIPRFETETLIEKTLKYLKKYNLENTTVLDIGTGSGCIAITLSKEFPELKVTAIDKYHKTLKVAKKNSKINSTKINFIKKDIFKYHPINKYGLIISNPPYIGKEEIIDPKTKYEPNKALYAKDNGLEYYYYIIQNAHKFTQEKNIIAFEIGEKQGSKLKSYAKNFYPNSIIRIEKDLSNKNRYLFIITE